VCLPSQIQALPSSSFAIATAARSLVEARHEGVVVRRPGVCAQPLAKLHGPEHSQGDHQGPTRRVERLRHWIRQNQSRLERDMRERTETISRLYVYILRKL
jgi:hypothetical protein